MNNSLKKELHNTQAKFAVDILELKPEEQPIKVMENVEEILNLIASKMPEKKEDIEALLSAAKKEQSAKTSRWIEENILLMQKDKAFRETSGSVALTYAADQARQGRYKALKETE